MGCAPYTKPEKPDGRFLQPPGSDPAVCWRCHAQDAAHIAANSPDVVKADVDEILRLRAEVERLNKEADWLAAVPIYCPDEVDQEAYWGICKREDCRGLGKEDEAACWRRAARVAVEETV